MTKIIVTGSENDFETFSLQDGIEIGFQIRGRTRAGAFDDLSSHTFNLVVYDEKGVEATVTIANGSLTKSYDSGTGITEVVLAGSDCASCNAIVRVSSKYRLRDNTDGVVCSKGNWRTSFVQI